MPVTGKLATTHAHHATQRRTCAHQQRPTVILLHGLLRTAACMKQLEQHIANSTGWETHTIEYPSKAYTIKELAVRVANEICTLAGSDNEVWAVTHSMGGIVCRHIMELPNQGGVRFKGVCMLAPPNSGSIVARRMRGSLFPVSFVFKHMYGKAGQDLGCELEEGQQWPLPPQPCGVIAGTQGFSLKHPVSWMTTTFRFFHGESDGTVGVEETRLPDMADFATVKAQHSEIMWHPDVHDMVVSFLLTQKFQTRLPDGLLNGTE